MPNWRRTYHFPPAAIVVCSFVLLLITGLGLTWVVRHQIHLQPWMMTPQVADAHRAALLWAASFLLFTAAGIWNTVLALEIIRRYFAMRTRILVIVVAGAFALGFLLINQIYERDDHPLTLVATALVPVTGATAIGNGIAAGVVAMVTAASFALMRRPRRLSLRDLRNRIEYARMSLFSAAALLIFGVAEIYLVNSWPAHVYDAAPAVLDRHSLQATGNTIGIVAGVMYSIVLLTVYVPLMIVQEQWVRHAAERAIGDSADADLQKWRETHMVTRTLAATISQMVAALGPLLTALGIPKLVGA